MPKIEETNLVTASDIKKLALEKEPYVVPAIQLVWCLSGRTSVLGDDVDKLKRAFDPRDDITRMLRAITIADEVNAQLAGKNIKDLTDADRVIPIYYNGREMHNKALKEALRHNLLPYPKRLFIIEPIFPENTIGQVQGFEKFLRTKGKDYYTIAVVTSEYHRLRAACTAGNKSLQTRNELGKPNALAPRSYFFYGTDKTLQAPGTELDVKSEPKAILNYSSWLNNRSPSIARSPSSNTFLLQSDVFNYIQGKISNCLRATLRLGLFSHKSLGISIKEVDYKKKFDGLKR